MSRLGGGLQACLDQAQGHGGEPPTCTKVNGEWVASWPDDSMTSGGGGFLGLVVLVLAVGTVIAVVSIIWRVNTAQRLARQSGLDPELATQMALFSDDGLDATYLAASLRQPPVGRPVDPPVAWPVDPPVRTPSVAERLAELTELRDEGVITAEEHDRRRAAIIDQL